MITYTYDLFLLNFSFAMCILKGNVCPFCQKPDAFAYGFQKIGTSLGWTQLRYNYYPVIPDISKVKPGQIRCGEHTDYGAITLLIQDDVGGLEVR